MQIFGYEFKRKKQKDDDNRASFVERQDEDGAATITASGGGWGVYLDLEGSAKTEAELITSYRQMMQQPEVENAVDDIVNEAIVISESEKPVQINLDSVDLSEGLKTKVINEFEELLALLDFSNKGYDIFLRWYVDGRLKYHPIIDDKKPSRGIQEIRYIDPRKIRKVREIEEDIDQTTGVKTKKVKEEYFVYNESGFDTKGNKASVSPSAGIKIKKDAIVDVSSGILNEDSTLVLSYLHKARKPLNQLRMLEDASVIYRIARAPERRVFYIDVGGLPKAKAEQTLREAMARHKNRVAYDASTGEIRNDRQYMPMMDDFWLPRREGGRSTEVTTLPGGQNLGEMEDILYFQKKLYKSLYVPVSRLESESTFNLGRTSEITRDELKFSKFIRRLRNRFSYLFDELLYRQLILKGIITDEDWEKMRNNIRYDYRQDNHFEELKEMEIFQLRVNALRELESIPSAKQFYSNRWLRMNILGQSDEDIKEMDKEIAKEPKPKEEEQPGGGGGSRFGGNF